MTRQSTVVTPNTELENGDQRKSVKPICRSKIINGALIEEKIVRKITEIKMLELKKTTSKCLSIKSHII